MDEEAEEEDCNKGARLSRAPKRTSPLHHWIDKNLPAPARAIAVAAMNKSAFSAI